MRLAIAFRTPYISAMKRLIASPSSAEIGLLKDRLEQEGIRCEIRNEFVSQAMIGVPFEPELWVLSDEDHARASELIVSWR